MPVNDGKRRGYVPCCLLVAYAVAAQFACAMPSEVEIMRVQPMVLELMAPHEKNFDAKKETAKEVGDAAIGLAKKAEGESAKYILLKGAIHYYARAKEYDLAADALESIRAAVKGFPNAEVASIASKALSRAGADEAQRLKAICRVALMRSGAEADVKTFRSALRKDPDDRTAMLGLADAYVRLGDWKKALKAFSKLGVKAAAFELDPAANTDFDSLKAADFWWSGRAQEPAPYRAHAAVLYKTAMREGLVRGLRTALVEKRIAEAEALVGAVAANDVGTADKLYCVIDLSAGPNADKYPVSYLSAEPKGGWTDEYKTTKLVLRRIEPGSFKMCDKYDVTLTKPFYIGVFEVTQRQYELVVGDNPAKFKAAARPAERISWNIVRGDSSEYNWPISKDVEPSSFVGRIRSKTGIVSFDLPTEAQWEYACRAGMTSTYNNGGDSSDDLKLLGRYRDNQSDGKGGYPQHTTVGSYQPNAWGLYDMHGNVWEWCLDWHANQLQAWVADPVGSSSGASRVKRGGSWGDDAHGCTSSTRSCRAPSDVYSSYGFRLARTLSE